MTPRERARRPAVPRRRTTSAPASLLPAFLNCVPVLSPMFEYDYRHQPDGVCSVSDTRRDRGTGLCRQSILREALDVTVGRHVRPGGVARVCD
jgi:hypothetical protein